MEDQATEFLLAIEVELNRRAKVNKKTCGLKGSRVKGLRELKGLFSSINYGSTSARRIGIGIGFFLLLNEFEASFLEC